jgi:SAM-dependent methyltransferase
MRLCSLPQSFAESIALVTGMVPTPLMDTLVALLLAKTVMAATALGVFDALEMSPLTATQIAERCGSDPVATEKLLRALCACKYLKWEGARFELGPVSRRWMTRKWPDSLRSAVLLRNLDLRFMNFEEYVQRGTTRDLFHSALGPEDWCIYHDGQTSHAAQIVDEVIERTPLPPHATHLLDLGGGHGLYSVGFCERYRNLRARVIDLAITTGVPESKWASDASRSRVEFQVGDIRTIELPSDSVDVVLLANVVHHFDESTNRSLIQRAARALRSDGLVIVLDIVRPRSLKHIDQLQGLLDLYFGAASGAGLWTIEDIQDWNRSAGLVLLPPKTMRRMPCCKMQVARKDAL